jgi:hypothetical protein
MVTMFEEYPTEEQCYLVRFFCLFVQKDSVQRIFTKKCFLFMLRKVFRVKRFHLGGKRFVVDEDVETEVRKWLRHQSKDFYAAGFDALVKRWDMSINVGGGYVEK